MRTDRPSAIGSTSRISPTIVNHIVSNPLGRDAQAAGQSRSVADHRAIHLLGPSAIRPRDCSRGHDRVRRSIATPAKAIIGPAITKKRPYFLTKAAFASAFLETLALPSPMRKKATPRTMPTIPLTMDTLPKGPTFRISGPAQDALISKPARPPAPLHAMVMQPIRGQLGAGTPKQTNCELHGLETPHPNREYRLYHAESMAHTQRENRDTKGNEMNHPVRYR